MTKAPNHKTTTFYVPVERRTLDPSNPYRWMILPIECSSPVDAMHEAAHFARHVMGLKGTAIWAAVRDIPSFEYMQELRDSMGRHSRKGERKIAGYC